MPDRSRRDLLDDRTAANKQIPLDFKFAPQWIVSFEE